MDDIRSLLDQVEAEQSRVAQVSAQLAADLAKSLEAIRRVRALYSPEHLGDHWLAFPFNARPIKVTGEFRDYGGFYTWEHEGIDFSLPIGVPILACASGQAVFAGVKDGYGNCVRLEHLRNGERWWTWYGHLSLIRVQVGQIVVAGEAIGASGNTGNVTGAHLHLTVQREDCSFQPKGCSANLKGVVNPRDWLQWPI
jgi:murein DD-endopeptidase MepM/ murein hydrolase activator NlpD